MHKTYPYLTSLRGFTKRSLFLILALLLHAWAFAIGPITGTLHVCANGYAPLGDITSGGSWSSHNTGVATVAPATGTVYGVSAGTSVITYTVGGSYSLAVMTVNPIPAIEIVDGGGSYCQGGAGVHIGLATSQSGVNYELESGSVSIGPVSGGSGSIDFGLVTVPGTYVVAGTLTTNGCSDYMSGSVTVAIIPTDTVSLSISANHGDTICVGTPDSFVAVAVGEGVTPVYEWLVNGVAVGGDSASYKYLPANGDVVQLMMVSSAACPSPDTIIASDTITVYERVTPAVSVAATPGTEVCRGTPAVLTAVPAYGGPSPVYTWKKNGAMVGYGDTYTFTPIGGDTVHCIMVSDFLCLLRDTVTSPKVTMTVDSPIAPFVTIQTSAGTHIAPGQVDTLTAVVTEGGAHPTFTWYIDSTEIAGDSTSQYISNVFAEPYPDSITCVVVSGNACHYTSFTWVYIVVVEGDEGVQGVNAGGDNLSVYPNPDNGTFTVAGAWDAADTHVELTLADMLGHLVYAASGSASNGRLSIPVTLPDGLMEGMYVLRLHSRGGEDKTFRISIRK